MQNLAEIKNWAESILKAINSEANPPKVKKLAVANQPTKKQQARQMIEAYWQKKYPGQ